MRRTPCLLLCLAAFLLVGQVGGQRPTSGAVPHDPVREAELLKQVQAPTGFTLTLFAGPPIAIYPTCLTGTVDGAVFVCVDGNLSLSGDKGRGRVVRLTDTDHDGRADHYSVFAEMDSPRGVVFDGKTLYVMHPPYLSAYRDTNGDGIADEAIDLVRGLGVGLEVRTADHGTNGITLGIDGWLYVAVGDYGFREAVGRDGITLQHHGGGVARVRTDGTGLEMYAKGTRNIYDLAVDPFLRVFTRDNTNDGDGWDTRLHYLPAGANMGYPALYKNFAPEHMPSLFDYGGGSGTGGLWIEDPGLPEGYANTLYTTDWTTNKVLKHPLTAAGGSFKIQQDVFLSLPHPSDMAQDGMSNIFVASLSGGSFTYAGDSVGYVVRVSHPGSTASKALNLPAMTDAQLRTVLASGNDLHRLQAQREILRRGEKVGVVTALQAMILDPRRSPAARVATLFTLKQLIGDRAQATLLTAAKDPAIRALALRAYADSRTPVASVPPAPLVLALSDTSAKVQLEALAGLVRVHALDQAAAVVPLTASSDAAVAHIAVNALASLRASDAALAGLASGNPAVRTGSLRALQLMHDAAVVAQLIRRLPEVTDSDLKLQITLALARLYNIEAPWVGDWWGTRPSFIGPYFAPVTWEGSAQILPVLKAAVAADGQQEPAILAAGLAKNRIIPQGAPALFAALPPGDKTLRTDLVNALVGSPVLTPASLPVLTRIDATGRAGHLAVGELLGGESSLPLGAVPLARNIIADTTVAETLRGKLLGVVALLPDRSGLEAAAPLFALSIPAAVTVPAGTPAPTAGPVEAAWRKYVGDRKRAQELDYFIELTKSGTTNQKVLGYAVLIQSVRTRPAAAVSEKVLPVLEATWANRAAAVHLVNAVTIMRLDAQYATQLETFRKPPPPPAPAKPAVPMDWVQLFNGKDLKNWDIKFANHPLNENFNNTFRVEDGLLKVRYDNWTGFAGEFGHIFTKQAYSYYLIAVEYRFVGEQVVGAGGGNAWAIRNNGIMVHSQSAASMGFKQDFPISLEVQLLGGLGTGKRGNGNLCTPGTNVVVNGKATTAHCINSTGATFDGDQWVRVEALVLGDSILKHVVNGDTVLTYTSPTMGGGSANNTNPGVLIEGKPLAEGFISLQAETAPIDFRKVEIVNLVGCMDPKSKAFRSYFLRSDPSACKK